MSIFVVHAFIQLREMPAAHKSLWSSSWKLKCAVLTHDQVIAGLINAIRELMKTPDCKSQPIGFTVDIDGGGRQP